MPKSCQCNERKGFNCYGRVGSSLAHNGLQIYLGAN
jgi:hypothetical protein